MPHGPAPLTTADGSLLRVLTCGSLADADETGSMERRKRQGYF